MSKRTINNIEISVSMENEQTRADKGPENSITILENSSLATNEEKPTVAEENPTSVVEDAVVARTDDTINIHINESSGQADALAAIEDSCSGSPLTADALNPNRKRPRDQPEMAKPEQPPNTELEMAEKTLDIEEEENATKVAKITKEGGVEETREEGAGSRHPKPKRRKIAIFVAYCGVGYQGMQRNPGAKTIEGDLEEALFKAGAISEDQYGDPRKVDWMRSARTDKGVSAVGQVVSGRFFIDPPGLVERVNSHLPEQIRVLGYKRVTASFSAKKFCDRRRYEYVIPLFALDPSAHRDRESVLASEGKEGALIKCLECSERGRKVPGLMGKKNEHGKALEAVNNGDLNETTLTEHEQIEKIGDMQNSEKSALQQNGSVTENGDVSCDKNPNVETTALVSELNLEKAVPQGVSELENSSLGPAPKPAHAIFEKNPNEGSNCSQTITLVSNSNLEQTLPEEGSQGNNNLAPQSDGVPVKSSFQYGEKERDRFNSILKQFVGTHNFHNFTTRIKAEDPAANRYILSFEASDVFTINGMDFMKCTIVGQSFVLHQIRKMIGLAVAVMRNCAPESIIARALRKDVHMNVPTAPELGLFLDESFFPAYNQKWQATHEDISLKEFAQQIVEFKQKYIYTHIASTEVKDGVVAFWLHSLNQRNYLEFAGEREAENVQNGAEPISPKENMADMEVLAK